MLARLRCLRSSLVAARRRGGRMALRVRVHGARSAARRYEFTVKSGRGAARRSRAGSPTTACCRRRSRSGSSGALLGKDTAIQAGTYRLERAAHARRAARQARARRRGRSSRSRSSRARRCGSGWRRSQQQPAAAADARGQVASDEVRAAARAAGGLARGLALSRHLPLRARAAPTSRSCKRAHARDEEAPRRSLGGARSGRAAQVAVRGADPRLDRREGNGSARPSARWSPRCSPIACSKGMRLQTDPTVIYGMGEAFDGNIRKKDLTADTPWNTYTRDGLPPTPIAMPGARVAAGGHAARRRVEFLYFVGKGDGTHQFSRTLEEHNRAVAKYQLGKDDDARQVHHDRGHRRRGQVLAPRVPRRARARARASHVIETREPGGTHAGRDAARARAARADARRAPRRCLMFGARSEHVAQRDRAGARRGRVGGLRPLHRLDLRLPVRRPRPAARRSFAALAAHRAAAACSPTPRSSSTSIPRSPPSASAAQSRDARPFEREQVGVLPPRARGLPGARARASRGRIHVIDASGSARAGARAPRRARFAPVLRMTPFPWHRAALERLLADRDAPAARAAGARAARASARREFARALAARAAVRSAATRVSPAARAPRATGSRRATIPTIARSIPEAAEEEDERGSRGRAKAGSEEEPGDQDRPDPRRRPTSSRSPRIARASACC